MTNEIKINSMELMNEAELNAVAGGTVKEFSEILSAISKKPGLKKALNISGHLPGGNLIGRAVIEKAFKDNLGIEADISLGFLGTGAGSDPNTYKEIKTGKMLTHQEVLSRIAAVD